MSLWYCWLWPQSSIMCIMWITHRLWGKSVCILNWILQMPLPIASNNFHSHIHFAPEFVQFVQFKLYLYSSVLSLWWHRSGKLFFCRLKNKFLGWIGKKNRLQKNTNICSVLTGKFTYRTELLMVSLLIILPYNVRNTKLLFAIMRQIESFSYTSCKTVVKKCLHTWQRSTLII